MMRSMIKIFVAASLIAAASSKSFIPSNTASLINDFYKKQNRFKIAFLTCSTKACTADLAVQLITRSRECKAEQQAANNKNKKTGSAPVQEKKEIDFRRAAVFLLYGGLYQGMAQEYIYNDIYANLFGSGTDIFTAAKKVATEMFVLTPLLCIPVAYLIKGLMGGGTVGESLKKYKSDVVNKGILFINWSELSNNEMFVFCMQMNI
jgi:hypothetical protein